jgi:hypothetical protein
VARDTESIERDIERAREQLATTLDKLGERADPRKLADQVKGSVLHTVTQPKVIAAVAGVGLLVSVVVLGRFRRVRRENQIIKAIAAGQITL